MNEFESMLKDVILAEPRAGYRIFLRFEDGVEGEVDIDALVEFEGVFAPLREKAEFDRVRVNPESGTIEWPGGADIDPVVLYSAVSGRPIPDFRHFELSK